jgi:hypothetical protein
VSIRSSTLVKKAKNVLMEIDKCSYCGRIGNGLDPDGRAWHIDHVIPISKGGPDQPDNLVKSCVTCNTSKNTELWEPLPGTITAAGTTWWPEGSHERHIQQLRAQIAALQERVLQLENEIQEWAKDDLDRTMKLTKIHSSAIQLQNAILNAWLPFVGKENQL